MPMGDLGKDQEVEKIVSSEMLECSTYVSSTGRDCFFRLVHTHTSTYLDAFR